MNFSPSRSGALAFLAVAGIGLLSTATAQTPAVTPAPFAPPTDLQPQATPAASPAGPAATLDPEMKSELAHTDSRNRHLAPHGTFFLLSYVSVKTDKGVQGFEPGQEVHLIEVHPATRTLVVTDGTTQVEVPPSKLTHDVDIAAMVRQKDAANQVQVAAYTQQQQEAYARYEREAADATAKDINDRKEEQQERIAEAKQTAQDQLDHPNALSTPAAADSTNASVPNVYGAGYYNSGGYGYGSPYAYFVNNAPAQPAAPAKAPAAPAAAPGNVAVPAAPRAPGRAK